MKTNIVISNAFSLNMVPANTNLYTYWIKGMSVEEVRGRIAAADSMTSIVGHNDTATVFSNVLGVNVNFNRTNYTMDIDGFAKSVSGKGTEEDVRDVLIVGQYVGPRLPEGATNLPEGATIKWFLVDFYWEYN